MRLLALPSTCLLLACAPSKAREPVAKAPATIAAPAPQGISTEAAPPRAPQVNRCLPRGRVAPPPTITLHSPSTCAEHRRQEAVLGPLLVKRYQPMVKGSRVDVQFACDPLTFDVREVQLQLGYGHGGYFAIFRLWRDSDDAGQFEALGIAHRLTGGAYDKYTYDVASRFEVRVSRGRVDARAVLRALEVARPALTASVREMEPPALPNMVFGRSSFFSSGNFHNYVRIIDSMPQALERQYTGYPSSPDQGRYLGVQLAMEQLSPLVVDLPEDSAPLDEAELRYFTKRFIDAAQDFERESWWVRDRWLRLAGRLGGPVLVPALLPELQRRIDEARSGDSESREASLVDAVVAMQGMTGWDARVAEDGSTRPVRDVAVEYLRECRAALDGPP